MNKRNAVAELASQLLTRSDDQEFRRRVEETFQYLRAGEDVIALENLADNAYEWGIPLTGADLALFQEAIEHHQLPDEGRWRALAGLLHEPDSER